MVRCRSFHMHWQECLFHQPLPKRKKHSNHDNNETKQQRILWIINNKMAMPALKIETNVAREKLPADFHLKAAVALSEVFDCPVEVNIKSSACSRTRVQCPCLYMFLYVIEYTCCSDSRHINDYWTIQSSNCNDSNNCNRRPKLFWI